MVRAHALSILSFAALLAAGCVSGHKNNAMDGELQAVDVEDPDPEKDKAGPQFCNPTGKAGVELQKCYEHNETLYKSFDEEAKKREPWYNFTPDSWVTSKEIDPKYVEPVVKEDEAVKKLEASPLIELSAQDAKYFGGKEVQFPGMKPYLVRGLMFYKDSGAFEVFEKDQAIYVRHDSLGDEKAKGALTERRTAVILWLPYKPKQVYVDCQVSE